MASAGRHAGIPSKMDPNKNISPSKMDPNGTKFKGTTLLIFVNHTLLHIVSLLRIKVGYLDWQGGEDIVAGMA